MSIRILFALIGLMVGTAWAAPTVTDWEQLIPEEFNPRKIMERHGVRFLDLSDPAQKAIFDEVERAREQAPVNTALEGARAHLRGFVVPLDGDGEATTEMLLVPEYGYCIHVPPPPANQLILVKAPNNRSPWSVFSEVEVIGTLHIQAAKTPNGQAGYLLRAEEVRAAE